MPDLYTNLVLNDTQFKQGLARADAAIGTFDARLKSLSRSSETFAKVLKFGGIVEIANRVTSSFDSAFDRQQRIIDGAETFRDKWDEARGSVYSITGMIPFLGEQIQKVWFHLSGGTEAITKMAGDEGAGKLRREFGFQLRLLEATTKEQKRQIILDAEHQKRLEQINKIASMTNQSTKDILEDEKKITAEQKKGNGGYRVLQGGNVTGAASQLPQYFGWDSTKLNQKPGQVTSPGPQAPKPGPTTPPAQIKAAEETAKNTKAATMLLELISRKIGHYG